MLIKVLQDGLLNEAEAEPKTYTGNEFIAKYGIYAYADRQTVAIPDSQRKMKFVNIVSVIS